MLSTTERLRTRFGLTAVSALTVALTASACSGPVPIAEDPVPVPDASTETNTSPSTSDVTTHSPTADTSDTTKEPVEEVYTCGDVNAVPYQGRLLTRAQYQNTVTDLFGDRIQGRWVDAFPAENEVGGFRTNAESHRVTSWLAEAHLTAAEAISAQVRQHLDVIAPCATAPNLAAPSSDQAVVDTAVNCARSFLSSYGFRAFRRPLTATEEQPFVSLFELGYREAGAAYGLELMTQALLLSPQFLYRLEAPTGVTARSVDGELVDGELVDSFGLASRLSYLLWNSMPDEELFAAAQSGALEQPEVLRAQAERLLGSPKALAAIADFAEQWLGLSALNGAVRRVPNALDSGDPADADPTSTDVTPSSSAGAPASGSAAPADAAPLANTTEATDGSLSQVNNTSADTTGSADTGSVDTGSTSAESSAPAGSGNTDSGLPPVSPDSPIATDASNQFTPAWRASLVEFVSHMYANDASFSDLMLSNKVYINSELAELYGADQPAAGAAEDFVAVEFPDAERAGLLTQPGLMAMLAHADQSAPILRGVFVLDALLCQPPPPAPASVDTTPPMLDPNATTRERFLQHTVDPACSGCHTLIDPVGLGLENYDELGRYRERENGLTVDASGELIALRDSATNGAFQGAVGLAQRLSTSAQAEACFVSKWYQYGAGRGEGSRDVCTINQLKTTFAASGGNLRELLVQLVLSDAFRYRTLDALASTAPEGEP